MVINDIRKEIVQREQVSNIIFHLYKSFSVNQENSMILGLCFNVKYVGSVCNCPLHQVLMVARLCYPHHRPKMAWFSRF